MLAETIEDGVKAPQSERTPSASPRSRGWRDRIRGLVLFEAIDGRSRDRAHANAPFAPRRSRGLILLAAVPGLLLLAVAGALFWHPLASDPDTLSTIPVAAPSQTAGERKLIQKIGVLREGLWEARLPPWTSVPYRGIARVSNPDVHDTLDALLREISSFGDTIGDRAPPGVRRDRIFLGQLADLRARLKMVDAKLGGVRSITAYHLGLLALWAGDAADAEPQFESAIAIAQKTEPLDDEGKLRLDGIAAAASYGLGLSQASRGLWKEAIANFDAALTAACRASLDGQTNNKADTGFVLGRNSLVPLDTRSVRNDRLIALLQSRGEAVAVTSPTCSQLLAPAGNAASGDADAEARALFPSLSIAGDPTLAANLQLRAALMGDRDVVQQLSFDGTDASAEVVQAQSLARAIAGLEPLGDAGAGGVDKSALSDLQHLSVLKARLNAQLNNATLTEPESDASWNWSDPTLFHDWKKGAGAALAGALLARAGEAEADNPGLAAALYGVVIDNRAWMPTTAVTDAWWRINTGISLTFALWMLALAAAVSAALFVVLRRWRETYRTTFESYHHDDRIHAPEG